jgi:hypothetical protein
MLAESSLSPIQEETTPLVAVSDAKRFRDDTLLIPPIGIYKELINGPN